MKHNAWIISLSPFFRVCLKINFYIDPREKSPGAARTCSGEARCALRRGTHSLPKLRACPGMKGQLRQVAFKHQMENEAQGGGRTDHEAQRNQCGRGPCFWSPRRSRLGPWGHPREPPRRGRRKRSGEEGVVGMRKEVKQGGKGQGKRRGGVGVPSFPEPSRLLLPGAREKRKGSY